MFVIMFLLFIVAVIALILGLIKPRIVGMRSRGLAFLTYAAASILFVIIGVATTPSQPSASTAHAAGRAPSTSQAASTQTAQNSGMPSIGQTFTEGGYKYKVNSVEIVSQITPNVVTNDVAQGAYYVVNVTVTNITQNPQSIDTSLFTLLNNGSTYAPDNTATEDSNTGSDGQILADFTMSTMENPGVAVTGNIVFDVPKGLTKGYQLQVLGAEGATNQQQIVNLK